MNAIILIGTTANGLEIVSQNEAESIAAYYQEHGMEEQNCNTGRITLRDVIGTITDSEYAVQHFDLDNPNDLAEYEYLTENYAVAR